MAGKVGIYIDADMSDGIRAATFIREFMTRMTTEAHVKTVVDATHGIFSSDFDKRIGLLAKTNPESYHHVYEYSPSGDGYRWIGDNKHKLWIHTKQKSAGSSLTFSWNWLPAKQYNPSYEQRRRSTVGYDALRQISMSEYRKLLSKHRENPRKWKFIWKAPMLEYGIARRQNASGVAIMMPVFDGGGAHKIFRKFNLAQDQQPGSVTGNFVSEWTQFWGSEVPGRWDEVLGRVIEKDASVRIERGISIGKKANRATRTFKARTVGNYYEAMAAGREQAIAAMNTHRNSIRQIEKRRGVDHAIVY